MPSRKNISITPEVIIMHNQLKRTESNSLEAISAYLNVIKNKGANGIALRERNEFLSKLNIHLGASPKTNRSFRESLRKILDETSRNEWTFYLTVGREYLPFWINDIKSIAALSKRNGFNLNISRYAVQLIDINTLRDQVLSTSFSIVEKWALNSYAESLRQDLVVKENNPIRLTMAKMIVFKIRSLELSQTYAYKMAVDLIMPSFETAKARILFADVSNSFSPYYDGRIIPPLLRASKSRN